MQCHAQQRLIFACLLLLLEAPVRLLLFLVEGRDQGFRFSDGTEAFEGICRHDHSTHDSCSDA